MSVSVVVETITTREDSKGALADDLRGTLEALAKQTVAPDEVIIVLDDHIEHGAADEVRRRYPYAKFAASKQSNYFAAKNAGAAIAAGDIVALLDGDCVPAPDWLELLLARLTPGVSGVAGHTRYSGGSLAARTLSVPDFSFVFEKESGASTGMKRSARLPRRSAASATAWA